MCITSLGVVVILVYWPWVTVSLYSTLHGRLTSLCLNLEVLLVCFVSRLGCFRMEAVWIVLCQSQRNLHLQLVCVLRTVPDTTTACHEVCRWALVFLASFYLIFVWGWVGMKKNFIRKVQISVLVYHITLKTPSGWIFGYLTRWRCSLFTLTCGGGDLNRIHVIQKVTFGVVCIFKFLKPQSFALNSLNSLNSLN